MPFALLALVVIYEFGPSHQIQAVVGNAAHIAAEILFYGTVGPVLTYVLFDLLIRWLDERETSDLQAHVLAQARERADTSLKLTDDALQALYAANVLLTTLAGNADRLPEDTAVRLREIRLSLDELLEQLQTNLQQEQIPAPLDPPRDAAH